MELLRAINLKKSFYITEQSLFENVSFAVNSKESETASDHIGIIGNNGAGKSTLIKILTGEIQADEGKVVYGKEDFRFGILEQGNTLNPSNNIYDEAFLADKLIFRLKNRLAELEKQMEFSASEKILSEYGKLQTKFIKLDGYNYDAKVEAVLDKFGFAENDFKKPVSSLSGGEKTCLRIAKLLIKEPDIIILDEPTNHLDIENISRLENFLRNYEGAFFVVSHDREFLNNVCNRIFDIRFGKLRSYKGNYDDYLYQKQLDEESALKEYEKQQKKIKTLQNELRRRTVWSNRKEKEKFGEQQNKVNNRGFIGHKSAKMMKRAITAKNNIERLLEKERAEKPETEEKLFLTFPDPLESSPTVARIEEVSQSFGSKTLFTDFSLKIRKGDRIAFIGGNGTGKSTLIKAIADIQKLESGTIKIGNNIRIGYYSQELDTLNPENSVLDEVSAITNNQSEARKKLGSFGIRKDNVFKKVHQLSFGERSKVQLIKLLLSRSNFLLLDEPTNHLDIKAKETLEDSLIRFDGTFIIVSHDRYFVRTVAEKVFCFQNGEISASVI